MPAILARMWLSLTKIAMVPIIAIARSAFWIVGGLSKLSFGQKKIPENCICNEAVPLPLYSKDTHGIPYKRKHTPQTLFHNQRFAKSIFPVKGAAEQASQHAVHGSNF